MNNPNLPINLKIIWMFFAGEPLCLAVIVYTLSQELESRPAEVLPAHFLLLLVALVLILIGSKIPDLRLKSFAKQRPDEFSIDKFKTAMYTAIIIQLAVFAGAALLGVFAWILTQSLIFSAVLFVIAELAVLLHHPNPDKYKNYLPLESRHLSL